MEFRPCIDIHNGKVKQIVGGTLRDAGDLATENFVSEQDAAFYARLYRSYGIRGGHIILLNAKDSPYYEATKRQALAALAAYPGGLQVGGGITAENAREFLDAGASHVIVTSYVFRDGRVNYENLKRLIKVVGRERLVLDLSCRRRGGEILGASQKRAAGEDFLKCVAGRRSGEDSLRYAAGGRSDEDSLVCAAGGRSGEDPLASAAGGQSDAHYYIVTDRWQKFTEEVLSEALLDKLSAYADEFLIHAVDVEGKASGMERPLVELLGGWAKIPVTYAGGVGSFVHLDQLRTWGKNRLNVTIGSALDLFGGSMPFEKVLERCEMPFAASQP